MAQRIREEATDNWDDKVAVERFTGKGGTLFRGHGRITAPGEVTVGGDVLRARRAIVINTGTQPFVPPIAGLAGTPYWTNREAGAGAVGVDESARAIPVDDHLRVAPGVRAIGDITGHGAFTHMSMYQGNIVVHDILGEEVSPAEYHAVPRVTFTDPEIGSVGFREAQARDHGMDADQFLPDPPLHPGLDPQGGQRRVHQAGR